MTKKFSPELYAENNKKAIDALSDFLIQKGWEPLPSDKESYKSHDLIARKGDKNVLFEAEIKKVWKKYGEWQGWSSVDIPYRKKDSNATHFVMFNESCDTLLIILMSKVLESKLIEKDTIYTKSEKFFNVPIEEFTMYVKGEDGWM